MPQYLDSYTYDFCILDFGYIVLYDIGILDSNSLKVINPNYDFEAMKLQVKKMFATEPDWSYYNTSSEFTKTVKDYWTNVENLGGGDITAIQLKIKDNKSDQVFTA